MPVTVIVEPLSKGAASTRGPIGSLTFEGTRVAIGRSASCDVRLPDTTVSARHASIRRQASGYMILDEGSTNGTRVNGARLNPHAARTLKSGDEIAIGRVRLEVKIGAAPVSPALATRQLALAIVARALGESVDTPPRIRLGDALEGVALQAAERLSIGRDASCALRIEDATLAGRALDVALIDTGVVVTLLDAQTPAAIGERALEVGVRARWAAGDRMTLGAHTLWLDDPIARALDESEHGDDAAPPSAAVEAALDVEGSAAPPEVVVDVPGVASVAESALPVARATSAPPVVARPAFDRRGTWRSASATIEIVALIVGLTVLAGSIAGLYWLLRK